MARRGPPPVFRATDTALYFPYVVPSDEWIKRSLLLYDNVSSIVPSYRQLRQSVGSRRLESLMWLQSSGLWSPMEGASELGENYHRDIQDVLLELADRDSLRFTTNSRPAEEDTDVLLDGKLAGNVVDDLRALDLVETVPAQYGWLVHRDVLLAVLSVTARHLAAFTDPWHRAVTPSTDSELGMTSAYGPARARRTYHCRELLVKNLLPVPVDCSFDEVVSFRESRRDEVESFRVQIERLVREASLSSEDDSTAISNAVREASAALTNLESAAKGLGVRLARAAAVMLVVGLVSKTAMGKDAADSVLLGAAGSGAWEITSRQLRAKNVKDPYLYAVRTKALG